MAINVNIRIPLINPVYAVIYPLDISGTWAHDPPGDPTTGYHRSLREPHISWDSNHARTVARQESAAVSVPCQVEEKSYEELSFTFGGDDPVTSMAFLTHRQDLTTLGLIDATSGNTTLKKGDRIDHIENRQGLTVLTFQKPLYIYEVRPSSWGAGPAGYDLHIIYTSYRDTGPQ